MPRVWLLVLLLLAAAGCAPRPPLVDASGPAQSMADWPAPDAALAAASSTMDGLQSLREELSTQTFRDDKLFLAITAERAYAAPDRRYERMEGRSAVETVKGETIAIGPRFFKRVGDDGVWQEVSGGDVFAWPGNEYEFPGAHDVAWAGPDQVDGKPARILVLAHDGSPEQRNQGWQFKTRLWIDPETNYFLQRETKGQRDDSDPQTGKPMVQRYEGHWTYLNPNASISISEPIPPTGDQ